MTAVVNEGLRLSRGVISRMPRVMTHETLQYGGWIFSARYPSDAVSLPFTHKLRNAPEPYHVLATQRWLKEPKLAKPLFASRRGSRSCLGMNLVYAEVYMTLAYVLRLFEMETYRDDQGKPTNDCFIGMTDVTLVGNSSEGFSRSRNNGHDLKIRLS